MNALAVLGTALTALSMAFGVWQWRRSGARVKVSLDAGWMDAGGGIAFFPAADFVGARDPDPTDRKVALVSVVNSGRSSVDVSSWWVTIGPTQLGGTRRYDPTVMASLPPDLLRQVTEDLDRVFANEHNDPCPYRLEAGSTHRWVLLLDDVQSVVSALAAGQPDGIGALVHLGDGRKLKTRKRVAPAALGLTR